MSEDNYFEIIKHKLDTLVDQIIQKESSDENFRITYAQILEKINTKMDVFSASGEIEKIELLGSDVQNLICQKDEIVHQKLSNLLTNFEELNEKVQNSVKTPEVIQAFNMIQHKIQDFTEEMENQRAAFNSIVSFVEKSGSSANSIQYMEGEFSVLKGQIAIINDTMVNQIKNLNTHSREYDQKFVELISTINTDLNELIEQNAKIAQKGDTNLIFNKIEELKLELENSKGFVVNINSNLMTLIDVVDNLFQDEDFGKLNENISNILVNTAMLSESIQRLSTKEEITELVQDSINEANCDNKKYTEELISALEDKLIEKLDFSAIDSIKDYTEKMLYQGTEVLKEEIWTIKDNVTEIKENIEAIDDSIGKKLDRLREEVADNLSKESLAKSYQFENITDTVIAKQAQKIEEAKDEITDIISEESIASSNQIGHMHKTFVTQLVQIAENISFIDEAQDLHEHIDEFSEDIKTDLGQLKTQTELKSRDLVKLLETIGERITGATAENDYIYTLPDVESDLSKIRLDLNNFKEIYESLTHLKSSIENIENAPIAQEISQVKDRFDELNDDISSISKRTNKLILTSDEVNKTLQRHIDEFTSIVQYFDNVTRRFTEDSLVLNLTRKIENLTHLANSMVTSDRTLNEAFMYLAEWVDSMSESFGDIKEKVNKMAMDTEQAFAVTTMQSVTDKIDEQEAKLVIINEKLDSMIKQKSEDTEVKSLLEFIASQVGAVNEKIIEHDKTAQRVENMEKQLKKIEKNVAILTSYIEEDDDE